MTLSELLPACVLSKRCSHHPQGFILACQGFSCLLLLLFNVLFVFLFRPQVTLRKQLFLALVTDVRYRLCLKPYLIRKIYFGTLVKKHLYSVLDKHLSSCKSYWPSEAR